MAQKPSPGKQPLGSNNMIAAVVEKREDVADLITVQDTFAKIYTVEQLKTWGCYPQGIREVVAVIGPGDISGRLRKAVCGRDSHYLFNQRKSRALTLAEVRQRIAERLMKELPMEASVAGLTAGTTASKSNAASKPPLEEWLKQNYQPLANALAERQRLTTAARQFYSDSSITQPRVKEVLDDHDAEQGYHPPSELVVAVRSALEVGGVLTDDVYLGQLVAAAKKAGFPLLTPAGAKRIAENIMQSKGGNSLKPLASIGDVELQTFLASVYGTSIFNGVVPPRLEQSDFEAIHRAMAMRQFAIPAKDAAEEERIRKITSAIRQQVGVSRTDRDRGALDGSSKQKSAHRLRIEALLLPDGGYPPEYPTRKAFLKLLQQEFGSVSEGALYQAVITVQRARKEKADYSHFGSATPAATPVGGIDAAKVQEVTALIAQAQTLPGRVNEAFAPLTAALNTVIGFHGDVSAIQPLCVQLGLPSALPELEKLVAAAITQLQALLPQKPAKQP